MTRLGKAILEELQRRNLPPITRAWNCTVQPVAQCVDAPDHLDAASGLKRLSRPEAGTSKSHTGMDCCRSISWWSAGGHYWRTGLRRTLLFALDEDPAVITQRVRNTIEE